jgi:hypothetical protein
MGKPMQYSHSRTGDTVKIEIKDFTRRTIYKSKFNITDKNAIIYLIKAIEKYSGFSVLGIIEEKLKIGEWW